MQQAKMKIEGMHCGSCAIDIKETLEERDGIRHATVDYDGKTALVEFDENMIQSQTLVKLIQDLGYNASLSMSQS
jgi:copper chaperone CopZ